MTDEQTGNREQFVLGLRRLADILEKHPLLPLPESRLIIFWGYVKTKQDLVQAARALGRTKKQYPTETRSDYFGVIAQLSDNIEYGVCTDAENVCRSVGVRRVIIPERTLPECVIEIKMWECDGRLFGDADNGLPASGTTTPNNADGFVAG